MGGGGEGRKRGKYRGMSGSAWWPIWRERERVCVCVNE